MNTTWKRHAEIRKAIHDQIPGLEILFADVRFEQIEPNTYTAKVGDVRVIAVYDGKTESYSVSTVK